MRVNKPIGFSLIWHVGKVFHLGRYKKGLFSDNNALYNPAKKSGWGIKVDFFRAWIRRPIPRVYSLKFWRQSPKIWDMKSYFTLYDIDRSVARELRNKVPEDLDRAAWTYGDAKKVNDFKYGIYNPWKGFYWFRIRIRPIIPLFFVAISTPWRSFYVGFKTSKISPWFPARITADANCGDVTWTDSTDEYICGVNNDYYRAAVPSGSIRRNRK